MIKPFYCPRCDRTLDLPYAKARKLCPECAAKAAKERDRLKQMERREETRFKKQQKRIALERAKAAKRTVTETDRRIKEQCKQCKNCAYRFKDCDYVFCDYIFWNGHSRDRGNGPGDCRSFVPKGTKLKRTKDSYLWR